ncbi:PKD domain-containing protein [Candidatus Falkowbacteria bacterium]|nr:PKD domain-containing protein [Candidatus Falkowbacteria bacterium]MBT7007026.1 PKD domain-containing protein [Candidatus Falkowbacteria bacterium]
MRKKIFKIVFASLILFVFAFSPLTPILAQDSSDDLSPVLTAQAGEDKNVVVGRQVVFSALGTKAVNVIGLEYIWDFGDGTIKKGEEVSHTYRKAGIYRVKLSVLGQNSFGSQVNDQDDIIVRVDKDVIVLISDGNVDAERLAVLNTYASPQGILLVNIQETEKAADYVVEGELAQKIIKNKDDLFQASSIVIWTEKNIGINAFLLAAQTFAKTNVDDKGEMTNLGFNNKYFTVITDQNFTAVSRVAQSLYDILEPQSIVVTRDVANPYVFSESNVNQLLDSLRTEDIDHKLLGLHSKREFKGFKVWNFLSYFLSYMVNKGVPLNTVYLILILPVIATVIAFFRQIVGVKALGIYAPSIIAISFLATGLKYGILIFIATLFFGTAARLIARKARLLYLPRMANVLTIVSLVIFTMFLLGAFFDKRGLMEISIFPILIMVLLTENFVSVQIERGHKTAVLLTLETLVLSVICFWLANWEVLRTFILAFPEFILLTLLINYLMGKWTGVRLTELYRFRNVIKNVELDEKK